MTTTFEIWLNDPMGRRLELLDSFESFVATKTANDIGTLSLILPPKYDRYSMVDKMIEVWRKPAGSSLKLFNAYLLRGWMFIDSNNVDRTAWIGLDGNDLLNRKIVAYAAGTAYASKTTYADNMQKAIVRENLGSLATNTRRDLSSLGFAVDIDLSAAPSLSMDFAWRNVLNVLKDISKASQENGTRLYFEMRPVVLDGGRLAFRFVNKINQPGQDLTGRDQVVFGKSRGNLTSPSIQENYAYEKNVIYAGGRDEGEERDVQEREDTDRSGLSPYARNEDFYNVSGQCETTAAVQAAGDSRLAGLRPFFRFTGSTNDSGNDKLGVRWNFGDRVIVDYRDIQKEAIINSISIQGDNQGNETVNGSFEIL